MIVEHSCVSRFTALSSATRRDHVPSWADSMDTGGSNAPGVARRVKLTPMEAAASAHEAARAAVESVVAAGGDTLYDHYLNRRELGYTVDRCLQDMKHVLNLAFLPRSEPFEPTPSGCGRWDQEAEPPAPRTDSWARGAVPLRRKAKPSYSTLNEAGAVASSASFRARTPGGASAASGASSRKRRGSAAGQATTALERPSSADFSVTGSVSNAASRPSSPTSNVRAQALAAMKAKQEARARKAERAAAEQQRQEELRARLSKELRGKDFTYDADGNVIVVSGVNAAKLPPQYSAVGVAISVDDPPHAAHQGGVSKTRRKKGKKGKSQEVGALGTCVACMCAGATHDACDLV